MALRHLFELLNSEQEEACLDLAKRLADRCVPRTADTMWAVAYACRSAAAIRRWGLVKRLAQAALALKIKAPTPAATVWLLLGIAHMYLGDLHQAELALRSADEMAPEEAELRAIVNSNYGFLMRLKGQFDQEVAYIRRAADGFADSGLVARSCQCELELAWSYLLQGDLASARLCLSRAEALLKEVKSDELEWDAQLVRALLCCEAGEGRTAQEICEQLLTLDQLSPGRKADALWILGCVARRRGECAQATRLAEQAAEFAVVDYWPLQMKRIDALRKRTTAH